MCQAVLSPNLRKKFQWEVSQIADNRFPVVMLLGGLSVNLNHLKIKEELSQMADEKFPCTMLHGCLSVYLKLPKSNTFT